MVLTVFSRCEDDDKISDPVYEFVSFKGSSSINLNENQHSEQGYPLVAQLHAFKPYEMDLELTMEITATNATENVDFTVTPNPVLKISQGKFVSDTLWIKTIDNEAGSVVERSIQIAIKSISQDKIKIGLGITDPKNASITAKILDDECSRSMAIFATPQVSNEISWGSGGTTTTVTGAVNLSEVTIQGDLIGYSPFSNAVLKLTLTPSSPGATKGTATFGEQLTGTDSDGYEYKFVEAEVGTYDVCSGSIKIKYDIYWLSGSTWEYWYSVTNDLSVP